MALLLGGGYRLLFIVAAGLTMDRRGFSARDNAVVDRDRYGAKHEEHGRSRQKIRQKREHM